MRNHFHARGRPQTPFYVVSQVQSCNMSPLGLLGFGLTTALLQVSNLNHRGTWSGCGLLYGLTACVGHPRHPAILRDAHACWVRLQLPLIGLCRQSLSQGAVTTITEEGTNSLTYCFALGYGGIAQVGAVGALFHYGLSAHGWLVIFRIRQDSRTSGLSTCA